jgi:hypothetical protein
MPATFTTMHFWLKVQVPGDTDGSAGPYRTFNAQAFWNGHQGDAGQYSLGQYDVSKFGQTFQDGQWHEVVVSATAANPDGGAASVILDSIAAQVYAFSTPVDDAGEPDPSAVVVWVDDIWFE